MFNTARKIVPAIAAFAVFTAVMPVSAFAATPFPQREFVASISGSVPDWRPHLAYNADEAEILTAVYEGLFVYDPYNLDPVPALAESWTASKDGLLWTFTIRAGASFSDGSPITANTFRDSWLNLLDPAVKAPYASLLDFVSGAAEYRTGAVADRNSVGIAVKGQRTLTVTLNAPAPHFMKILCHHAFSAVAPTDLARARDTHLDPAWKPVSSGAFVVETVSENAITLAKNPVYWDTDKTMLPSIRFLLETDPESLTDRFNRGEIDWLAGAMSVDKVADPAAIHITPMFSTEYFFFRSTWGPWSDSRIRNALLDAVPWEEFRADYLIKATTLVFPIAGYPKIAGIERNDTSVSKELLAEAGYSDMSTMTPLVIRIPESQTYRKLAEILEKAWEGIGFKVDIAVEDYNDYYGSLRSDDYSIGVTSWIGDFADPMTFLEMFRPNSSLNDSGWDNTAYEKLLNDAAGIKTVRDRYLKLAEAEALLLKDGVILPLSHNPALNVVDTDGLAGWYPNALDIHPFKFIRFAPKQAIPGVAMLQDAGGL